MNLFKRAMNIKWLKVCATISLSLLSWSAKASQDYGFTVLGPENIGVLRWLTESSQCPLVTWSSGKQQALQLRAEKAVRPAPIDATQKDKQPSNFKLTSCEISWPPTEASASIQGRTFQAPKKKYHRILLMGDTGCRLKASENAYQDCSNPRNWPFATNVRNALTQHPDLIVHMGDIHYRESPCPDNLDCRNSSWGYGSDAWIDDFFKPADPLLDQAPWVFVRGNHEACNRAGQGWFRFLDPRPLTSQVACERTDVNELDNFTPPYLVKINQDLSFVIFDSSAISPKHLPIDSSSFHIYSKYMTWVEQATKGEGSFAFLSHHPVYGMAYAKSKNDLNPGGNVNLINWFSKMADNTLAPQHTQWLMHGHIHSFEAIGYEDHSFSSFILGNSGSQIEGVVPSAIPNGFEVAPGLRLKTYYSSPKYGFAVIEIQEDNTTSYTLTEFDDRGEAMLTCDLTKSPVTCRDLTSPSD